MYLEGALYPQTDLKHWCELYGLWPKEVECEGCGELILIDIPFATRAHRGLQAKPCPCGCSDIPLIYVLSKKGKSK